MAQPFNLSLKMKTIQSPSPRTSPETFQGRPSRRPLGMLVLGTMVLGTMNIDEEEVALGIGLGTMVLGTMTIDEEEVALGIGLGNKVLGPMILGPILADKLCLRTNTILGKMLTSRNLGMPEAD